MPYAYQTLQDSHCILLIAVVHADGVYIISDAMNC